MQKTYKGQTAGGWLRKAAVHKMQAGNYEIVVNLPDGDAVAMLGQRGDGYGGTVTDVLVLTRAEGCIARLETSPSAYRKLVRLEQQVEQAYAGH